MHTRNSGILKDGFIMVIGDTYYMNVHGFTARELQRMRDYLLGAVQSW